MAEAKHKEMTADEFLIWCLSQDERYELVDGFPVPLRAMTGASTLHDQIAVNTIASLHAQLRGTGCRPTTPDVALRTAIKRVRRPDVTIECAPPESKSYESRNPIATFDVLSPTTRKTDPPRQARRIHAASDDPDDRADRSRPRGRAGLYPR
jgi:Uma2 family endonuclease